MTPGADEPPARDDPGALPGPGGEPPRADAVRAEPTDASPATPSGPPGSSIFSLEGRPAPGLYLVAWLGGVGGLALVLLGVLSGQPGPARFLALAGFLGIAVGLSSAAGYQVLARRNRHPAAYRGPAPLLVLGVAIALAALPAGLLGPLGVLDPARPGGLLAALALVATADLLAVWLLVVRTGALRWRDMGWPTWRGPRLTDIARDAGTAALLAVPVTIAARLFAALVVVVLGVEPPLQVPLPSTDLDVALLFAAAAVVAPVAEEALFRGLALTAWWRDLGVKKAIVRSALLFAVVHIASIDATTFAQGARQALFEFVAILPVGLFLGWLFTQRGMAASITAHAMFNAIQLAILVWALRSGLLPAT